MNTSVNITQEQTTLAFNAIFRQSTKQPGYFYWNLGSNLDSHRFRLLLIKLKKELSVQCEQKLNKKLLLKSLGRFNQQHSSKPHRDTSVDHSFLILGYEPTNVDSKIFVTDYTKYIEEHHLSLEEFFGKNKDANLVKDTSAFSSYINEIKSFTKKHYRILIVNNSKSFEEKTYGVFHSAEIPKKTETEDRIINYVMLQLSDLKSKEQYTTQDIEEFLNTDNVCR